MIVSLSYNCQFSRHKRSALQQKNLGNSKFKFTVSFWGSYYEKKKKNLSLNPCNHIGLLLNVEGRIFSSRIYASVESLWETFLKFNAVCTLFHSAKLTLLENVGLLLMLYLHIRKVRIHFHL